MTMQLNSLRTPKSLKFNNDKLTLHELGSFLIAEMNLHGRWTDECSTIMKDNPKVLFLYDRFEYTLGNVYGNIDYKIALNPMMLMCYHPDCLVRGPVVRLKHPFYLQV